MFLSIHSCYPQYNIIICCAHDVINRMQEPRPPYIRQQSRSTLLFSNSTECRPIHIVVVRSFSGVNAAMPSTCEHMYIECNGNATKNRIFNQAMSVCVRELNAVFSTHANKTHIFSWIHDNILLCCLDGWMDGWWTTFGIITSVHATISGMLLNFHSVGSEFKISTNSLKTNSNTIRLDSSKNKKQSPQIDHTDP